MIGGEKRREIRQLKNRESYHILEERKVMINCRESYHILEERKVMISGSEIIVLRVISRLRFNGIIRVW